MKTVLVSEVEGEGAVISSGVKAVSWASGCVDACAADKRLGWSEKDLSQLDYFALNRSRLDIHIIGRHSRSHGGTGPGRIGDGRESTVEGTGRTNWSLDCHGSLRLRGKFREKC